MQEWLRLSLLLCTFGFLKEIRPSEPFVAEFLIGPWKNFTEEQVNRDIFPVATYSHTAQLIIVFLVTDFLKYKPLIIVLGLSGIVVWSIQLWTNSLLANQISSVFYGTCVATEVAYYTYIYAKVEKKHFSKVTSHTRAAILCGQFLAGSSGQLLIYMQWMDYRDLNYITLATQILATVWACFLPSVRTSVYFHRKVSVESLEERNSNEFHASQHEVVARNNEKRNVLQVLWVPFKRAYTNRNVLIGSFWLILGLCGYLQVIYYIQILWTMINVEKIAMWNGAVEAGMTLLGALSALGAGYIHSSLLTKRRYIVLLSSAAIIDGLAIFLGAYIENLFVSYAAYLTFGVFYSFAGTVASAEIAKHLEDDNFGLVFGFNTFLSLVLQTILTLTVVNGVELTIFYQFYIYASYFVGLGIAYLVIFFMTLCSSNNKFGLNSLESP
ncbi:thiamine transporter 1 [Sergentomyia squamirostris]